MSTLDHLYLITIGNERQIRWKLSILTTDSKNNMEKMYLVESQLKLSLSIMTFIIAWKILYFE